MDRRRAFAGPLLGGRATVDREEHREGDHPAMAKHGHIMIRVPPPAEVFEDLRDFLVTASDALEAALRYTDDFFGQVGHPFDPYLFPSLVRYRVKTRLDVVDELGEDDVESFGLSNIGILVLAKKYAVRILKADEGRLPAAGTSQQKQQFYRQQLSLPVGLKNASAEAIELNLVLLWHKAVDGSLRLTLACPKWAATSRESVLAHWYLMIDSPVDLFVPDQAQYEPVEDLDMRLTQGDSEEGPIVQQGLPFGEQDVPGAT